jgi:hypothetical protein
MGVKRVIFLCVALALITSPSMVFAQGFYGSPETPFQVNIYTGWVANGWMTSLGLDTSGRGVLGYTQFDWEHKTSSAYAEVAVPFDLDDLGVLTVSVGGQLPGVKRPGNGQIYVPEGPITFTTEWDTDTYWATVGSLLAYPISSLGGNWLLLGGFQYDCWQTSFSNRHNWQPPWWPDVSGADTADLTVNMYIPKVGVMNAMPGLTVGAVATPLLFGSVSFRESQNSGGVEQLLHFDDVFDSWGSWYVEAFGGYSLPASFGSFIGGEGDFQVSLFGRFIYVAAKKKEVELKYTRVPPSTQGIYHNLFDLNFRRGLFIIGGKAALNFNLPDFGSLL